MKWTDVITPEDAKASATYSAHRRELAALRRKRRKRLRALFAIPFAIGLGVVIQQLTSPGPTDGLVLFAGLCCVPFLATFDMLR